MSCRSLFTIVVRRGIGWSVLCLGLIGGLLVAGPAKSRAAGWLDAQTRVVKIFGAGGTAGLEAYQSGVLISPEGMILTVWSAVLDTDQLSVVLDDGRNYLGELWAADPGREIALVKIDAEELAAFRYDAPRPARVGERVWAWSNLFGVAQGAEAVSVQHGVVAAIAPLEAGRGVFLSPYRGPVYVLDNMTNNPGAAGGALVDGDGALLGLLGKELRSTSQGVWLNYALPLAELAGPLATLVERRSPLPVARDERRGGLDATSLGIVLVPDVVPRTPAYVESVRPGTPAADAGLRADDLVVSVAGRLVRNCQALREALTGCDPLTPLVLGVLRQETLVELTLDPRAREAAAAAGDSP